VKSENEPSRWFRISSITEAKRPGPIPVRRSAKSSDRRARGLTNSPGVLKVAEHYLLWYSNHTRAESIMKLLNFIAAVLFAAATHANMVQARAVHSGPPEPPPQAVAGCSTGKDPCFNALARNDDFSKPIDVDCEGAGKETQNHEWYTGLQGTLSSGCGAGINPVTNPRGPIMSQYIDLPSDGGDGSTVLNLRRTVEPMNDNSAGNAGNLFGRVGISTLSTNFKLGTKYPINLYVECVTRNWPMDVMGSWLPCWGGSDTQPGAEMDIYEFHSSDPIFYGGSPQTTMWTWDGSGDCGKNPCTYGGGGPAHARFPNFRPPGLSNVPD
jgi:hypothetical protein